MDLHRRRSVLVVGTTDGGYWAAGCLARFGESVPLADPLGGRVYALRRVKSDARDAGDLADLRRMGRLPEAWIAPPATRELRGWVRHRAKLVGLRSKCEVPGPRRAGLRWHAAADERPFRPGGQQLLATARLAVESRSRSTRCCG